MCIALCEVGTCKPRQQYRNLRTGYLGIRAELIRRYSADEAILVRVVDVGVGPVGLAIIEWEGTVVPMQIGNGEIPIIRQGEQDAVVYGLILQALRILKLGVCVHHTKAAQICTIGEFPRIQDLDLPCALSRDLVDKILPRNEVLEASRLDALADTLDLQRSGVVTRDDGAVGCGQTQLQKPHILRH